MPRTKKAERTTRIEDIIGAAQNADVRMAELEAIARNPQNKEAIAFVRRRLAMIVVEARALRQEQREGEA